MNLIKSTRRIIFVATACIAVLSAVGTLFLMKSEALETMTYLAEEDTERVHAQMVAALTGDSEAGKKEPLQKSLDQMIGGLFDWAEVYSLSGQKVVESSTKEGKRLESGLPKHKVVGITEPTTTIDESGDHSIVRIVLPIYKSAEKNNADLTGYIELGRDVPYWSKRQTKNVVIAIVVIAASAALIGGLILYPRILFLLRRNRESVQKVLDSHIQILESLGLAVAKRESGTGIHNYRVTWIAATLGESLGLTVPQLKNLIAGSFLHDVGKIAVPDQILLKPAKLTPEEMSIMQEHVNHGVDIVKNLGWFADSLCVVASHHERWDGNGYPNKLAGTAIPMEARIFAVADVFDALCSKRPYKEAFEFSEVVSYIKEQSGTHFDPAVVAAFSGIADTLYTKTQGLSEVDTKKLLEPLVQKYFSVDLVDLEST